MSDATAAPSAPAAAPTAAPAAPQAAAEELIELMLEEGKPPVKVPVKKIPVEKMQPHLEKYRKETDRLRSEYDLNAKSLAERSAKLEAVLKAAKEDTDGTLRELGIDPEEYAERKLAARVRAAMREEEEKADPTKKTAREADEERDALRKENEDLKKKGEQEKRDALMGRLKNAVEAVKAKLPEQLREHATADVIAVMRQAVAEKRDPSIEDLAKVVQKIHEERYAWIKGIGVPKAETPKAEAAVIQHPASRPASRDHGGKFTGKTPENDGAGDVLQKIARGKF